MLKAQGSPDELDPVGEGDDRGLGDAESNRRVLPLYGGAFVSRLRGSIYSCRRPS